MIQNLSLFSLILLSYVFLSSGQKAKAQTGNIKFNPHEAMWQSSVKLSSGQKAKVQTGYIKYNPQKALWQPGQGCPIEGCVAKKIVSAARLKMHWREKHEKLVTTYACSLCSRGRSHKRRSDLNYHVIKKHKMALSDIEITLEEKLNLQFMDPSPLTLALVLGDV